MGERAVGKRRYGDWVSEEGLVQLCGWARAGLSEEEIAGRIGIAPVTLAKWKSRGPEIGKALRMGREWADRTVEDVLFKKATEGDLRAIRFWLEHRLPAEWGGKTVKHGSGAVTIVDDLPAE